MILSLVTTIIAAVNVIATYFAFRWIDKFGRRKLSMGGYAGMAVSAVVAGLGLLLLTGMPEIVVMMIALNAFVASFAIGVGGTGWLLQGEVFPTAVRGQAAAIAACVDWTANFALIEVFPTWQTGIGLGWIMICFAVTCLLAIVLSASYCRSRRTTPSRMSPRSSSRRRRAAQCCHPRSSPMPMLARYALRSAASCGPRSIFMFFR